MNPSKPSVLGLLVAIALALGAPARAAIEATLVVSALATPLFAAAPAGDPRLFVVERDGRIRIADPTTGTIAATPFLDIADRVGTGGEGGLLGLAFPADFATSAVFYVYYTDLAGDSVLSRFALLATDQGDPASEEIVLGVDQPFSNHNGGTIAFGPLDGMLYVGLGDGGSGDDPGNRAQDPQSLLGKMLRLDVSGGGSGYTVPPDNPFVGARDPGDAVRDEIWSLGWRNPFRWGFDRATGELWVGDVGQGVREELDREPAYDPSDPGQAPGQPGYPGGRNYGWRVMEGTRCNIDDGDPLPCNDPAFTPPVHEYNHTGGRCSITGGVPYRGSVAELQGQVFFGDWCTGEVWTLDPDTLAATPRTSALAGAAGTDFQLVAFAEDGTGELYLVLSGGEIHRIDGPGAGSLSKGQQRCVHEMNRRGALVVRRQNAEAVRCIDAAVRGRTDRLGTPADPQSCLTNDTRGRVAQQAQKLIEREAALCPAAPEPLPPFAYTGSTTVLDAARGAASEPVALVADLFGADLGAALVALADDRPAALCQVELGRRSGKLADKLFDAANRSKRDALAGKAGPPVASPEALASAVRDRLASDPRVAAAAARLQAKVGQRCAGVAGAAFPGVCSGATDATALAACAERVARCRFCRAFDRFDATALGCDDFDDGLANGSCP